MRAVAVVLLAAALLGAAVCRAQADIPTYVVGRGGPAYPVAPGGYVPITLHELQSKAFLAAYNPFGLALAPGDQTMGVTPCALFAVAEGVLAFGPASNITLLGPFDSSGSPQTGSTLSAPVWLGGANGGNFIGPTSQAFMRSLYTEPGSTACSAGAAYWAIFRRADFGFGRTGSDYPNAPASDPTAVLASLADLRSSDFVTAYNAAGIAPLAYPSGGAGGCCALRVREGFVTYTRASGDTAFVVPHFATSDGTDACNGNGFAAMNGNQRFATRWAGANDTFLEQLDFTSLRGLGTSFNGPAACDAQPSNTFALFKSAPTARVVPDCYEVLIESAHYVPSSQECLAERWNYDVRNGTVQNVDLNSYTTCGSSTVTGFSVTAYNSQYVAASVSGLSGCAGCSGTDVLVPIVTGSEKTTLCRVAVGEFGFCEVLMEVWNAYQCPTPRPRRRPYQ